MDDTLFSLMFIHNPIVGPIYSQLSITILMFQKQRTENRAVWYRADDILALLCLTKRGSTVKLESWTCESSFTGIRRGDKCKSHSTDSRFPKTATMEFAFC